MHELYAQFLHLLNAVWHRRWAALGAAWLVALLGWALVVALPNTYTSSARIFIDATSIMKPVLEGLAIDVFTQMKEFGQLAGDPFLEFCEDWMLADEVTHGWYTARVRAHQGTSPSLNGPDMAGWRRAWALGDRRGRRRQPAKRWPDV